MEKHSGGSSGVGTGCFLTTAVATMRAEPDNGPTPSTLRVFRDNHILARAEEGRLQARRETVLAQGVTPHVA